MAAPQGKIVVVLGVNPSGVLRTLELDASDFLKVALASPATLDTHVYGYDTTTWRPLLVDASGRAIIVGTGTSGRVPTTIAEELPAGTQNIGDVDVASSALPSGAATSANQLTEITALQLIDDLRNALATVATDKLRASIVDALVAGSARIGSVGAEGYIGGAWQKNPILLGFSAGKTQSKSNTNLSAGTNSLFGDNVPAGELWIFTLVTYKVVSASVSSIEMIQASGGLPYILEQQLTPTTGKWYSIHSYLVLAAGDGLYMNIFGATAGDDAYFDAVGWRVDIDQ